jgi:DNA polymerase-3 subunit delta
LKLTADSLATHLRERLLPAYLISGDEPLLGGEAADAVRARARAAGFTEREVHFIERAADWDEVRASAANLSLFGARRVVEIRLATGRPGAAADATLGKLLAARDPDMLLLILAPRLDRDVQAADWVRALQTHGAWVQIWPVDVARLPAWLASRGRRLGLEVSEEALELLAARTEGNLLAAHQELTKLTLLAPGGRVTAHTVLASVADSARFDAFQLHEAALGGEAARTLRVLAGLRAEGSEATLALWALVRALRELWSVRAGAGNAAPWQRQGAALARGARRAPGLPYAALTLRAARADRMIKGRLPGDAWEEMALLAAELCGRAVLGAPALPARSA